MNLFLLISGWYGIKHIKDGIVKILLDCFLYGLFACLIYMIISGNLPSFSEFINSVKFTNGWYVPNYIILLLLSPIIERSLRNIGLYELRIWILILVVCEVYFGYFLQYVDKNGYSAINFILLYYTGRFLKLELSDKKQRMGQIKKISIITWFLSSFALGCCYLLMNKFNHTIPSLRLWSYNNPFVLIGSISFFIWFSYLRISNKYINKFATAVLGIYLVLSNSLITDYRNMFAIKAFSLGGYFLLYFYGSILVFITGLFIYLINYLRHPLLLWIINRVK